eukprot:124003-Chlamydomonas_euryale.AAC.20
MRRGRGPRHATYLKNVGALTHNVAHEFTVAEKVHPRLWRYDPYLSMYLSLSSQYHLVTRTRRQRSSFCPCARSLRLMRRSGGRLGERTLAAGVRGGLLRAVRQVRPCGGTLRWLRAVDIGCVPATAPAIAPDVQAACGAQPLIRLAIAGEALSAARSSRRGPVARVASRKRIPSLAASLRHFEPPL